MIDITNYKLLTPAEATLNVDKELILYYRNGDIISYENDTKTNIDLRKIAGAQNEDFNLVFYNRDDDFIKAAQKSEDFLQAIYSIFDFKVGSWVLNINI